MNRHFLFNLILLVLLSFSCCAFAGYDDYEVVHIPDSSIPKDILLPAWTMNPTDEELIAYTKALAASTFIKADLSDAEWSITRSAGGYTVKATVNACYIYAFVFLPDGQLAAYQNGDPMPRISQILEPQRGFGDEIAVYSLALLDLIAPSVPNVIECFDGEGLFHHESLLSGSIHGVTWVTGSKRVAAYFTLELEPMLQLHSYRLEPAVLQHLWNKNVFSSPVKPYFRTINEYPPQKGEAALSGLLPAEDLYPAVTLHLKRCYGETDASLRRFDVECELMAEGEPYYWTFHLFSCEFYVDVLDAYEVKLNALTGEILDVSAYEEGNG